MLSFLAASCGRQQAAEVEANVTGNVAGNGAAPVLPAALPEPRLLDREALLIASLRAASAAAAGQDDGAAQAALDGAHFELAIRFGCATSPIAAAAAPATPPAETRPAPASAAPPATATEPAVAMGWSYDAAEERLRVHAAPDIDRQDPAVAALAGATIEAAEGFWIPRPWLLSATCPGGAAAPLAAASPGAPSLGLVQFFTATDSRTERRADRPYESVQTVKAADMAGLRTGFDLVLSGRLTALNGKVIGCVARGPDSPPTCLISAEFGKVRLVRPDTKTVLAQWGQG